RKKLAKLEDRQKELEAKTVIMKRSCGGTKMQMILKRRIQELDMEIDEEEAILKETSPSKNYILSDYCFFQGNILLRLKRPGDARLLYLQTIDLNPLHKNAYSNLTNIYFLSKQYQQAFDCLNRAEQNDIAIKPGLKAAVLKAVGQGDTGSSMKEFPVGAKGIGIMKFVVSVNLGGSENKSLSENTYVVFNKDTSTALIIDPGAVDKRIENFIQERKLKVKKIMNTHGHYDHSNANRYYADLFKVKIVAHKKDKPLYTKENSKNLPDEFFPFDEGECDYLCEGFTIKIVSTPGHSPGSVCLLIGTNLLAGDTLFKNAIGKTWGKTIGEKIEKTNLIIAGIRAKLFKLPGKTRVFPGHGYASSIENEMASNDFLNKESALAILKDTFESLDSIHEILPMEKNSKDYDAKIVFFKKEGSNTFRGKYGETIYGLKLLLTSASKPVEK
ncbi:MAG: MBL fold metallo-hydrolase, partial [bacterium]|nr:MBL fold metallo-hydrolase [bacterium]